MSYEQFSRIKDVYLLLTLVSLLLIQATTYEPTYKDLDDEMRSYVKQAARAIGYDPDLFASHVTPTEGWATKTDFNNGYSSFYMITFDREFVEKQNVAVKKAIAGHEVGHAYSVCAAIAMEYRYGGFATYVDKENCADVASVVIFGYEGTLEALEMTKIEMPDAESISERINLLEEQFGDIGLTPDDE